VFLSPALTEALDRIAERAADVRRAYAPGAIPQHDDVATPSGISDFTLNPLSAVAPNGSFFIVRDEQGHSLYTRDGAFALRGGSLVDASGRPVLGVRTIGGALVELRVDSIDAELGRVQSPAIDLDGNLCYYRNALDPRSGKTESQRIVAGRLALAQFPAGTRLTRSEDAANVPPAGLQPQIGVANEGDFGALTPMHRERSRIDIDRSLARLKEAYLAFDALQAAEAAKAHLGKTSMDLLK
jgi:flagellar basal body rod protein FlgG